MSLRIALAMLLLAFPALVAPRAAAAQDDAATTAAPAPDEETTKLLQAVALSLSTSLEALELDEAELAVVLDTIRAIAAGNGPELDPAEWVPRIQARAAERATARAEAEKERGAMFVRVASEETGAQPEASGLLYIEETAGEGDSPSATDTVRVHYVGRLIDGTQFDSSYDRGQPAEFPLNRVIPCWTEGLQKMKPGGKARLLCPSEIAYGDRGRPSIPGGATLVFDVELLEVVSAQAAE